MDPGRRQFLDFLDEQSRADDDGHRDDDADPGDPAPDGAVFKEVKEKMIALQLRLAETENDLDLTRQALAKAREHVREQIDAVKRDASEQIAQQRDEFEAVIQRQMAFSKKVLEEKGALAKKVEDLIQAANQRERQVAAQIQEMKEQEQKRVQKIKATMKAAEKARRDRTIEEMRATIKQDTVRALEPEVQRLLDSHSDERRQLAEQHERALFEQREAHKAAMRRLRQQLEGEFQLQLEHERHLAQQRQGVPAPLFTAYPNTARP